MLRVNRRILQETLNVMENDISVLRQKLDKHNADYLIDANDMRILMVSMMSYLLTDIDAEKRHKISNLYQNFGDTIYGQMYGFHEYENPTDAEQE